MRAGFLITLYLAVVLAPLMIVLLQNKPPRSMPDELASGLGLVALAVICVEFVLSGRFRGISGRIGMDVTMRFHQLLARTAAVFILVHPFLYRTPMLNYPLPWDTSGQLVLGVDVMTLATGTLAWVLFFPFVALAIFRDQSALKYETWRWTHGLGAVLITGLILHHALWAGRYSSEGTMLTFWSVLAGLGLATLIFVYLISPIIQMRRPWSVRSVRKLAERTWEVAIEPEGDHRLRFKAGQFAWLNVGHSAFSLSENPFSISSAPASAAERIEFVIKEAGDFTSSLASIRPGTRAYLDGPHGNLVLNGRKAAGVALIAGGVGIAPLLGVLRQFHADADERPIILLYGNRKPEQIVYRDELDHLASEMNLTVSHALSEPPAGWQGKTGMIDKQTIEAVFGTSPDRGWLYLVCGPPLMIEQVETALVASGVPVAQIVSERFKYD